MRFTPLLAAATVLAAAACSSGGGMTSTPMPPLSSTGNAELTTPVAGEGVGDARLNAVVVYTLSNEAVHNLVEGYTVHSGNFQRVQPTDTHGRGDPSISGTVQGALAVDGSNRFLFAVDAGSNEITSFRISANGLSFADKVKSNGKEPVSLATHGDLLYVVNAGSSEITGFKVGANGKLDAIAKSTQPLSGSSVGPAEISFDPSGGELVVTEKTTSKIDTYSVANDLPSAPTVYSSGGTEPLGFAFVPDSNVMVVSDASGGAADAGAASSYGVGQNRLEVISSTVPDHNTAPCWVVITPNGGLAFTSNTGSDTISAYAVNSGGRLTLTSDNGISGSTGKGPSDLALSPDGRFLFVINLKSRALGAYEVGSGGKLRRLNDSTRLPDHALGLEALSLGGPGGE